MVKGLYHYIKEIWKKPDRALMNDKLISWRAGNAVVKVDRPLRIDRARALGYKAKKGFVVVRVRVQRGGRRRPRHTHGRRSKRQTERKTLKMSYQWVAEMRASKKYANLEVLNSYKIGQDGKHYFYEVILVDGDKPEIKSDRTTKWIVEGNHKGRAERGLTSAAKKSRGLMTNRGHTPKMKVRPSLRSWNRTGK